MAVVHQKIDAMLFQGYRKRIILRHSLQDLHARYVQLVTAGRAFIGPHLAFYNHAGFLRQTLDGIKHFRRNRILRHNSLNGSTAIAKNGKQQLAAFAQVVQPSADSDRLTFVLTDFSNCGYRVHSRVQSAAAVPDLHDSRREPSMNKFRSAISMYSAANGLKRVPDSRRSLPSFPPD